jgi:hypothetical protein
LAFAGLEDQVLEQLWSYTYERAAVRFFINSFAQPPLAAAPGLQRLLAGMAALSRGNDAR